MFQQFIIHERLPGLNEYIKACNTNRYAGGKMKDEWTGKSAVACQKLKRVKQPTRIIFEFYERNKKRDPDNISGFGHKAILDGMVLAGILPNDTHEWVKEINDIWLFEKGQEGVVVTIEEVEGE